MSKFKIEDREIGEKCPTYFIADIAANHDSDLVLAKELIYAAAESGADAAKFQHFSADTIVSDFGFKALGSKYSHQASWNKSVYEVYKDASINLEWTNTLVETCRKAKIHFFTSPYSFDLVNYIDQYVPAYKIGSGDITWHEIIKLIASKNKPYIIATGASSILDVKKAFEISYKINKKLCLMQCNTNYTAELENFNYINLNVLKQFKEEFPDVVLGLSDHTPGFSTVLGAITIGARMIEKHFTLDNNREGPDHKFSMNPKSWREMVINSRELELALGSKNKKVEDNELETVILQRRCIRASRDIKINTIIAEEDLVYLRPAPDDGLSPYMNNKIIGKKIIKDITKGDYFKLDDVE